MSHYDGGALGGNLVEVVNVLEPPALVSQPAVVDVASRGMLVVEGKGIHRNGNHLAGFHKILDGIDVKGRLAVLALLVQIDIDKLVISFHGMQKRRVVFKGDDYYRHCYETYRLIVDRLKHLKPEQAVMTFQSRFGSEEWITPYTEDTVEKLIEEGNKELMVYSPSFVADCLETTDELGHELAEEAKEWGGNVYPVECLNTNEQWCKDVAKYVMTQAEGSAQDKEDIEYQLKAEDYDHMPELVMNQS